MVMTAVIRRKEEVQLQRMDRIARVALQVHRDPQAPCADITKGKCK